MEVARLSNIVGMERNTGDTETEWCETCRSRSWYYSVVIIRIGTGNNEHQHQHQRPLGSDGIYGG
jgi:hypothetical protein